MTAQVVVYSTGTCSICEKTKACLQKWKIPYEERRVDKDKAALKAMLQVSQNARTVPQIVIEGKCIGGFSELTEMHMDGDLDHLVQKD